MNQFVTVERTDKQFWPLLTGTFSKTHFAQPVRNIQVNSANETVTFKLIEKPSASLGQALVHWYSAARNMYLVFPILGGLSFLSFLHGPSSLFLILISLVCLQFFLMAITLYSDYSDYINGIDRVNEHSSQKPLLQGVVRPYQAKQLALSFLLISFAFAMVCFYLRPYTVLFAVLALLLGMSLSSSYMGRHFKGVSIFATFLLAGPLLVLGYEYLLYEEMTLPSILLGGLFGLHALKYDFCKQVRDIYYNSKAKVATLPTFFGFEKSKLVYSFFSIVHIGVLFVFANILSLKEIYLIVIVALCFELYINNLVYSAPSFLSSNISTCMSMQKLHYSLENSLFVFLFLYPLWSSFLFFH